MNRPPYLSSLIAAAIAVLLIAALISFRAFSRFEVSVGDVTKIQAMLSNRPDGGPPIEEFEVPESFHKALLELFDGASPHRSQIDWAILGQLKITTNTGVLDVLLFSAGESIVFDVRNTGGKYETKSLSDFIRIIDEAKKAQVEQ